MKSPSLHSFIDELEKIAVQLTSDEKKRQALQFAGLGAVTVPAMSALSSKMMTGKWKPPSVSWKRWLPASVATGLFWGGGIPALQHQIARANIRKAEDRVEAQKELKKLAPSGVREALKTVKAPAPEL